MDETTYSEEVAAAREDVRLIEAAEQDEERGVRRGDEHRWDLARRTHENTLSKGQVGSQPRRVPLATWAEDVGRSVSLLQKYRLIWERFGYQLTDNPGDCPTFTEAWQTVVPGDRPEAVAKRVSDMHLDRATPEVRAETATRLLDDPDVMERVTAPSNPISRKLADAIDTQRAIGELDGILERSEGEPTESVGTYEHRVRERMGADAAMQHDIMMQRLAEYQAAYKPGDVAEAISGSPHTTNIGVYQSGAQMAIRWLQEFSDALEAQSRPRLVASQ